MPANIYGKNVPSLAVELSQKEFEGVFHQAGETGLLDLFVEGEEKARPVLIHSLQLHPVASQPLHVDFHQVDLKEKVKAMVPISFGGEPQAVKEKKGLLLTPLNEIEVEALPTDLPEHFEVDVSSLSEVDQEIKVADLKVSPEVAVLTDPDLVICKIGPLVTKEMEEEIKREEETKAEAAAAATEAAPKVPPTEAPRPEAAPETPAEKPTPKEEKKE